MKRDNKTKALEIISALPLAQTISEYEHPDIHGIRLQSSVQQIALGLQGAGVNVSSLSQAEWMNVLHDELGIDPGDSFEVLEQLAEWGATDDG